MAPELGPGGAPLAAGGGGEEENNEEDDNEEEDNEEEEGAQAPPTDARKECGISADTKAALKAALIKSALRQKQKETVGCGPEQPEARRSVTAQERQREREEKRRRRQERAKQRERKQRERERKELKEGDVLGGVVLSQGDKSLLQRWMRMTEGRQKPEAGDGAAPAFNGALDGPAAGLGPTLELGPTSGLGSNPSLRPGVSLGAAPELQPGMGLGPPPELRPSIGLRPTAELRPAVALGPTPGLRPTPELGPSVGLGPSVSFGPAPRLGPNVGFGAAPGLESGLAPGPPSSLAFGANPGLGFRPSLGPGPTLGFEQATVLQPGGGVPDGPSVGLEAGPAFPGPGQAWGSGQQPQTLLYPPGLCEVPWGQGSELPRASGFGELGLREVSTQPPAHYPQEEQQAPCPGPQPHLALPATNASNTESPDINTVTQQLSKSQVKDLLPPGFSVTPKGSGAGYGLGFDLEEFLNQSFDMQSDNHESQADSAPLSASLLADWLEVHRMNPAEMESLQQELQLGSPMILSDGHDL